MILRAFPSLINVSGGIFYLPEKVAIATRRRRRMSQAENVASDILYSLPDRILKGVIMRLDKYLKVSRIIKRRTVANEACDAGRVLVNDKPAKASVNVKVGDIIEILFGTKSLKVEVLDISETVKKDEAKEMYREL